MRRSRAPSSIRSAREWPEQPSRSLRDGQAVKETKSDSQGEFAFDAVAEGRYQIQATAEGFQANTTSPLFVGAGTRTTVNVSLSIGTLETDVTVTAAATPVAEAQIGAPVTVLDSSTIESLGNTDLLEPLRTVPGAAVVQTGGRGGPTALFIRGGSSNFNKILLDGVPANDIGGAFDFADIATTGIERVEVLRGSNSVIYGSDAMTGVVNITTRRGRSRIPELTASLDGGNLATSHEDVSVGGAVRRFDYFAGVSHLQTDNSVPNNAYRNNTVATRFGVMLGTNTDLSGTVRWIDGNYGSPNAFDFFGIADDSFSTRRSTYTSVAAQSQITNRWQSTVRFGVANQDYHNENPAPTGIAIRSFGVRELPRQRGDHHRRQRLLGDGSRHPGFRRHLSVAVRLDRDASIAARPDRLSRQPGAGRFRRRQG